MKPKSSYRFFLISFLIIVVDLATKSFAWAHIKVICNRDFAFGVSAMGGKSGLNVFSVIVSFIVIYSLIRLLLNEKGRIRLIAYSLVIGGGIANLIDRLIYGCVRDFIHLPLWPSFNLADSAITFGVVVLILNYFNLGKIFLKK